MNNRTQIDKLKDLIIGIQESGSGLKLTTPEKSCDTKSLIILPSINDVGVTKDEIEKIRHIILMRSHANNLESIKLRVEGSNSSGFKIIATEEEH